MSPSALALKVISSIWQSCVEAKSGSWSMCFNKRYCSPSVETYPSLRLTSNDIGWCFDKASAKEPSALMFSIVGTLTTRCSMSALTCWLEYVALPLRFMSARYWWSIVCWHSTVRPSRVSCSCWESRESWADNFFTLSPDSSSKASLLILTFRPSCFELDIFKFELMLFNCRWFGSMIYLFWGLW